MTCHLPVLRLLWLAIAVVAFLGLPATSMAKSMTVLPAIEGIQSQVTSSAGRSKSEETAKTCCNACMPATMAAICVAPDPHESMRKLHLPPDERAEGIGHRPLRKPPRRAV